METSSSTKPNHSKTSICIVSLMSTPADDGEEVGSHRALGGSLRHDMLSE